MDISVIIPAFNREKIIENCIMSVLLQTEPPMEIIVVDDGSTDHTVEIVRNLAKEYKCIRLLRLKANKGAQHARNCGIKQARGTWIAFLDSDDFYLPESLEIQRKAVEANPECDVFYGDYYILKNGRKKYVYCKMRGENGNYHRNILFGSKVVYCCMLVKKIALYDIGLLDEQVLAYQEWDTNIRLSHDHKYCYINKPLFVYNIQEGETISKSGYKAIRGLEYLVKNNRNLYFSCDAYETIKMYYNGMAFQFKRNNNVVMAFLFLFIGNMLNAMNNMCYVKQLIIDGHKFMWNLEMNVRERKWNLYQ